MWHSTSYIIIIIKGHSFRRACLQPEHAYVVYPSYLFWSTLGHRPEGFSFLFSFPSLAVLPKLPSSVRKNRRHSVIVCDVSGGALLPAAAPTPRVHLVYLHHHHLTRPLPGAPPCSPQAAHNQQALLAGSESGHELCRQGRVRGRPLMWMRPP